MPEALVFYLFAGLAIGASILVIGQRNPMYSVLLLVVTFAALAGLYVQLGAPFVAVAQIIIYAGAVMVLFLFVVMLLNAPREDAAEWDRSHPLRLPAFARFGASLALLLVVQLAWALLSVGGADLPGAGAAGADTSGSIRELGRTLFTDYVFAFEATSILILVSMVGAVVLARREGDQQ